MKKENLRLFYYSLTSLFIFVVFTLLVKFVNVEAIGPKDSVVGLAFLNRPFMFDINDKFDLASDLLLLVSILLVGICAGIGLYQWIKTKKLRFVDSNILSIPLTFIVTLLFIILFEIMIVNYRPVLIEGQLEASYPSTHTLLICTTLFITIPVFNNLLPKKHLRIIVFALYILLFILTLGFRVLSGVHYFTDILGGFLLAITMGITNKLFDSLLEKFNKE